MTRFQRELKPAGTDMSENDVLAVEKRVIEHIGTVATDSALEHHEGWAGSFAGRDVGELGHLTTLVIKLKR